MTKMALGLALVLLLPARVAAADARQLFDRGSKALLVGKAKEALKDFQAAYKADPAPSLLFWIAEAHRALGHKMSAAKFYRQYLEEDPHGRNVNEAKTRLAQLEPGRSERKRPKMALESIDLGRGAKPPPPAKLELPPAPAATASPSTQAAPPAAAPLTLPSLPSPAPQKVAEAQKPAAPPIAAAPPPTAAPPPAPPVEHKVAQAAPIVPIAAPPRPQPTVTTTLAPPPRAAEPGNAIYVQYTARWMAMNGPFMLTYATTTSPGASGTLYTHGVGVGVQTDNFRHGGYFGFGTQNGGTFGTGTDTLLRYELSYEFLWAPFGLTRIVSPHVGFRLGGMGVKSERLTGGSLKPGVVLAGLAGVDLQPARWFVLSGGIGYDENLGPDLGPNASISGYSFDLGAAVRY